MVTSRTQQIRFLQWQITRQAMLKTIFSKSGLWSASDQAYLDGLYRDIEYEKSMEKEELLHPPIEKATPPKDWQANKLTYLFIGVLIFVIGSLVLAFINGMLHI
ncbi:MAG: hypothetical protein ABSA18_14120 [Dehalococcoidia bacterium]|jgi:hypothetical protein